MLHCVFPASAQLCFYMYTWQGNNCLCFGAFWWRPLKGCLCTQIHPVSHWHLQKGKTKRYACPSVWKLQHWWWSRLQIEGCGRPVSTAAASASHLFWTFVLCLARMTDRIILDVPWHRRQLSPMNEKNERASHQAVMAGDVLLTQVWNHNLDALVCHIFFSCLPFSSPNIQYKQK